MKKKIGLIILQVLLIVALFIPALKATTYAKDSTNEIDLISAKEEGAVPVVTDESETTNDENEIMLINNLPELQNEVFENVYDLKEDVSRSDEIIYGNVYLLGNKVELKNVGVNGDLYILANNVKMDNTTTIDGNVYICASNVEINSMINKELFCVAKDLQLENESVIKYNANIGAEHVSFDGSIERNLNISADKIEIGENASVYGKLDYSSAEEAKIDENAQIKDVNFHKDVKEKEKVTDIIFDYFIDFVNYFIITMVLFIILLKIAPVFIKNAKDYLRVSSFGIGILLLIVLPVVCILLAISGFASILGITLVMLAIAFAMLAMAITNISVASLISAKNEKIKLPISTAISTLVLWALMQIPFVGGILAFCMLTTGLGIMFRYVFCKIKK